jgi:hypothetical protein
MNYSFDDKSFWRGAGVPMSEVVDKARVFVYSRFPEDTFGPLSLCGLMWGYEGAPSLNA